MSGCRQRLHHPARVWPIALALLAIWQAAPATADQLAPESGTLTLDQAMHLAAEHAPAVENARATLQAAQAELAKAGAAFNLTLSAKASTTASADATGLGGTAGGGLDITPSPALTFSAQANATTSPAEQTVNGTTTPAIDLSGTWHAWPPTNLSPATSDLATAQMTVMNAADRLRLAETQASSKARREYQNVQIDGQRSALARAAASAAQAALDRAGAQARQGALPRPDLLQAQIDVADARLQLQTAVDAERSDRRDLLRDAGLGGHPVSLSPWHAASYQPVTVDQASLRADAGRNDATLLAARRKVDLAAAELSAARARSGLAVDLQTSLTWPSFQAGPALTVGLSASYTIDDGGARQAAIVEAEAGLARARQNAAAAQATLDATLQQQIDALDRQALTVRKLTLTRDRARLLYRQAQDQARAGAITAQALAAKRRQAASAQLDLDAAIVDYRYQEATLQQTPGENPP